MSTLIIHPQDPSTNFLKPIYATIQDKTVITGGVTRVELVNLIQSHNRVMMLGHGTPEGLLNMGQFPDSTLYVIDRWMAPLLAEKEQNVFIWCHADKFVERHGLKGFYSGMFVSEYGELWGISLFGISLLQIDGSNKLFASIVSKHINEPSGILYQNVIQEYGVLAQTNPVAQYNLERLNFSH